MGIAVTAPDPTNPPAVRDVIVATLVAAFQGPPTSYDPPDLADLSCNKVFRASDGMLSITALTFGEVADALAERLVLEDPIETSIEAAFGEIEELRRQRDDLETKLAAHKARLHRARTERDELRAAVSRVRKLCDYYAGDTLWPSHVVAALDDTEEPT